MVHKMWKSFGVFYPLWSLADGCHVSECTAMLVGSTLFNASQLSSAVKKLKTTIS